MNSVHILPTRPLLFIHTVNILVKITIIVTRLTTSLPASSPASPNPFSMLQSELTFSVGTGQFLSFLNLRPFKIKFKFLNITHKPVIPLKSQGWIKHPSSVLSKVSYTSTTASVLCCNCLYTCLTQLHCPFPLYPSALQFLSHGRHSVSSWWMNVFKYHQWPWKEITLGYHPWAGIPNPVGIHK